MSLEIHADGKRLDHGAMVFAVDGKMFPIDSRFQRAVHGLEEVVAMRLDVKSDQIRAQHSVDQFPLPGADAECFSIRPGNMPENCNPRVGTFLLDQSRQQGEVVVLNQHQRLLVAAISSSTASANF